MLYSLTIRILAKMRLFPFLLYPVAYQSCTHGAGGASAPAVSQTDSSFISGFNDTIRVTTRLCTSEKFSYTIQSYGKLQTSDPSKNALQSLADRHSSRELYAIVGVLESDFKYIKIRQLATIRILGAADEIAGWVTAVNSVVDDNGIIEVKIKLSSQQGLLAGMNVLASIRSSISNQLVVPKEAVIIHGDSTVVFTLRQGKSVWNYVTLGNDNGREVEVLRGLRAGDKVIISNNIQLTQDSPVKEW